MNLTTPLSAAALARQAPRHPRLGVLLASAVALSLLACSPKPTEVPPPSSATAPAAAGSTAGADDPSVPSAGSVVAPTNTTPPEASTARSTGTLSNAQESSAMPMPGQNNDHSAPATPAARASAP